MTDNKDDRGPGDLTMLIDQYKKEIWAWKQKESEWIKTDNQLQGNKRIIEELTSKLIDQERQIQELKYDNRTYREEIKKVLADKNK
jgi:predicted RNase H-like nuclease (RuvC/YqgF family)